MILENKIVDNRKDILKEVAQFATQNKMEKIVIFSKNGESAISLKKLLIENKNSFTSITAVLFPANEQTFSRNKEGAIQESTHNPLDQKMFTRLAHEKIQVIFGTLPFENVIIPGAPNNIYNTIKQSLSLFSPGLQLAIQAALMATDQGKLTPGEEVISVVSDIAVSLKAANSRLLFHPKYGLKIHQIITQLQNNK